METKDTPKVDVKDLIADLRSQTSEYTIGKPGEKPISYVYVKEGIMEVRKTRVGTFARMKMRADTEASKSIIEALSHFPGVEDTFKNLKTSLVGLPSCTETPAFRMEIPKIPVKLLYQVIRFFRAVYDKQETEAAAVIRYNMERKEFYVEIPDGPDNGFQDLSAGGVKYNVDPKNQDPIVIDLHSHHTMAPNFSSIDDGDEKSTQLYGVVGNMEYGQAAVNFRARMGGEDVCTLVVDDIFDTPVFPAEWMDKIKEPIKTYHIPSEGQSYQDDWNTRMHRDWGSLPGYQGEERSDVPVQADGESDEDYMARLQAGKEGFPAVSSAEVEAQITEVCDALDTEVLQRPEVFQDPAAVAKLKRRLHKHIAQLDAKDVEDFAGL